MPGAWASFYLKPLCMSLGICAQAGKRWAYLRFKKQTGTDPILALLERRAFPAAFSYVEVCCGRMAENRRSQVCAEAAAAIVTMRMLEYESSMWMVQVVSSPCLPIHVTHSVAPTQ